MHRGTAGQTPAPQQGPCGRGCLAQPGEPPLGPQHTGAQPLSQPIQDKTPTTSHGGQDLSLWAFHGFTPPSQGPLPLILDNSESQTLAGPGHGAVSKKLKNMSGTV